jgi:uncharacterized protein with von Willebrand factor type A (vWA) domain
MNTVETIDISTRPKRRNAIKSIRTLLTAILAAEDDYLRRMPENFLESDAANAAETSIECISDAICNLQDAY